MLADKQNSLRLEQLLAELDEFTQSQPDIRKNSLGLRAAEEPGILTMQLGGTNTRIVFCPVSRYAAVVDPSCNHKSILSEAERNNLSIKEIWLTHSHPDHCGGAGGIIEATGARLLANGHSIEKLMRRFLIKPHKDYVMTPCPELTRPIYDGEVLRLGAIQFKVFHTPGHSPGHVCFHSAEYKILITGDLLFKDRVGGCPHLIMGSPSKMLRSFEKILTLPDDTKVLPGHGDDSTLGSIKAHNEGLRRFLEATNFRARIIASMPDPDKIPAIFKL